VVSADIVIKEHVVSRGFLGAMGSEGTEVTYVKGDKIRVESRQKNTNILKGQSAGGEGSPLVTVVRLDKGIMWQMNQDDETFMETALAPDEEVKESHGSSYRFKDAKVTKTEEKQKIAGRECQGVNIELVFEMARGDKMIPQTGTIFFWVAPKSDDLKEMYSAWEDLLDITGHRYGGAMYQDVMEELKKTFEELDGVPLGMDMTVEMPIAELEGKDAKKVESIKAIRQLSVKEGKTKEEDWPPMNQMRIVREVISISTDKLDDSLFEIPEGYRKAQAIRRW
jgi:hypothetical protein